MMGEIESVRVSEVVVPTEKLKEMSMSLNVWIGINRANESSRE